VDAAVANAAQDLIGAVGLALLLAGCAGEQRPGWLFKTAAESALPGPIAIWGPPEAMADAGFGCSQDGQIEFWLVREESLTTGHLVPFAAGRAKDRLAERFEVDGVGRAVFPIPRGSPLLAAIAGGANRLEWRLPGGGRGSLRLGEPVRELLRQCAVHSSPR
jgi:hypothetical protein